MRVSELWVFVALSLAFFSPVSALAATITVNETTDELNSDGDCSLREAVKSANEDMAFDACVEGSGDDEIMLPGETFLLTLTGAGENDADTGDLDITDNLTITGVGAAVTIVDGNQTDRVFEVDPNDTGVTVTLSDLTIQNGLYLPDSGGGIITQGDLNLNNCIVAGNFTESDGGGLMKRSAADVTITNCIFRDNVVEDSDGGAIYFSSGGGTLTITRSLFTENISQSAGVGSAEGAALALRSGSTTIISQSTFSENQAVGLADSNDAGAIGAEGDSLTILNSTFSNNVAGSMSRGGAIFADSPVDIVNSTFSGNSAGFGGAINLNAVTVRIKGSVFADNVGSTCDDPITSAGYNIFDDDSCGILMITDRKDTDPLLGPPQDIGGPTLTHALLPGSDAIDNIPVADCEDLAMVAVMEDQRGAPRPANTDCDSGAFEVQDVCGDAFIDPGEECDDGSESDACNDDCTQAVCGDGKLNASAGEECDDGNTDDGDGCAADCTNEAGAGVCGDGVVDAGEECDDGNTDDGDGCAADCTDEVADNGGGCSLVR